MAEVDSLEIQIESNAKSAFSALGELEEKLKNVSDMLNAIGKNEGYEKDFTRHGAGDEKDF